MSYSARALEKRGFIVATAESVGVPFEWLTPKDIGARWPLVRSEDLVGALFHPTDGYINPADVTQAMAKGARQRGVEIVRKAQVDGYEWTGSEWIVRGHIDRNLDVLRSALAWAFPRPSATASSSRGPRSSAVTGDRFRGSRCG